MNFNMQNGDGFFKILRMESEVVLPLPPVFAKKHFEKGHNETQPIILETVSGDKWKVKYAKIKDEHYFVDGWFEFIKENCLKKYDFLIFWLESPPPNTHFKVIFFGPEGCLMHPPNSNTADTATNVENETSDDNSKSKKKNMNKNKSKKKNEKRSVTKIIQKSYFTQCVLPLTRQFGEETGIGGDGCAKVKNKNGEWQVKVSMVRDGNSQKPRIVGSQWSKFLKENEVKIGDTCKITHVKDNVLRIRVIKKEKTRS